MAVPLDLPPRDWQDFEDLCCDLWRCLWNDPGAQLHGRQGHAQTGVDVFGRGEGGGWEGVQCKQTGRGKRLSAATIRREAEAARGFEPELTRFILATTAPRDPALQKTVRKLNDAGELPFEVEVCAWDDIAQRLQGYPALIGKYYAGIGEKPEPAYPDEKSRKLGAALNEAYLRHEELTSTGADPSTTVEEILELRRRIREGGTLKPGDFLSDGRFRLLEPLGRGGFSSVFKAYDREQHQGVAVKVLHGQYAEDKSRRERFFRGARKMAQLQHQGIVRVIEPKLEDGGYHFFVMELASGGDLRQAVMNGSVTDLAVLRQIAEVLDFAHRSGVVHRDVKPANILLTAGGEAKLTDFDLVRAFDTTGGTRTGSMLGTFLYMAPEAMHQAKDVDARADVYSLAMTAAFVLHGQELPPTMFRDPGGFFGALDVPEGVREALERAASWEPDERPSTATSLLEALEAGFAAPGEAAPQDEEEKEGTAPAVTIRSLGEIEKAIEGEKDWRKRRDLYTSVPEEAADSNSALATLRRLCRRTCNGNDLFFLDQAIQAVGKKWPEIEADAAELERRLFDHITAPPEHLFRRIATAEGEVDLWREVPAGSFQMGSLESEKGSYADERPRHEVLLKAGFEMAAVPVTRGQYAAFDPAHEGKAWKGVDAEELKLHPVASVTWYEAVMFCRWLSARGPWAHGARVPREEEWEYACRAGTETRYWSGDKESDLGGAGWYAGNSGRRTHRVGRKAANAWGLYDVHGNVWEWTVSEWSNDYSGREGGIEVDPSAGMPAAPSGARVYRGGSFWNDARNARSACRDGYDPDFTRRFRGFRVLLPASRGLAGLDHRS